MNIGAIVLRSAFWLGIGVSAADAATTTWVSATGKDSGSCPVTAPCASFQYAHNETSAGGTINVATQGSYGPVTITKSISILAPEGTPAIINVAANGRGVVLSTSSASIVVLRGLTINGPGTAGGTSGNTYGIMVDGSFSGQLTIDHVTITNVSFGAAFGTNAFVLINNCLFDGNFFGVYLNDNAVYMGKTTISGNQEGLSTGASVNYTINSYGDNVLNGNVNNDLDEVSINEVPHDQ